MPHEVLSSMELVGDSIFCTNQKDFIKMGLSLKPKHSKNIISQIPWLKTAHSLKQQALEAYNSKFKKDIWFSAKRMVKNIEFKPRQTLKIQQRKECQMATDHLSKHLFLKGKS